MNTTAVRRKFLRSWTQEHFRSGSGVERQQSQSTRFHTMEYDLTPLTDEKEQLMREAVAAGALYVFGYGSLVWKPGFPHTRALHGHVAGFARRFWQASPDHRGTPVSMGRVCTLARAEGELCHGILYEIALSHASDVLDTLFFREKAGYACERVCVVTACGRSQLAVTFTADDSSLFWAGPPRRMDGGLRSSNSGALASKRTEEGGHVFTSPDGQVTELPSNSVDHDSSGTPHTAAASACADKHDCLRVSAPAGDPCDDGSSPAAIAKVIAFAVGPSGSNLEYFLRLLVAMRGRRVADPHLEELFGHVVAHREAAGLETPLPDHG